MAVTYTPDSGDIVFLRSDSQVNGEQFSHDLMIVLSPVLYNQKTGLMVCCPLTREIKGYPFEVLLDLDAQSWVVLADQVTSLDWQPRQISFKTTAPIFVLDEIRKKIKALLLM